MSISANELKNLLKNNEAIIIDVRTEEEFEEVQIMDSTNIPLDVITLDKVESVIKEHGKDKFWGFIDKLGTKFWSQMPWMPEGKKLFNYIM